MKSYILSTINVASCPECGARPGEFCQSTKGRRWTNSTHQARRQAARAPRLRQRHESYVRKLRRTELLENLWRALKAEDKPRVVACAKALRASDAEATAQIPNCEIAQVAETRSVA